MSSIGEPDAPISLEEIVREANDRLAAGDTEAALEMLAPVTADDRIYLPAQFLLSMTAWKMGRLDWSIELMRQCHETHPMDGTVAEALASLYAQAGDLRESLFMGKLGTALGGPGALSYLVPKGFPTFDWAFYHVKKSPMLADAKACLASGKPIEAMEKAGQHVALNRQDGDAHGFYAALLLRNGFASAAVDLLQAIEVHADLPARYASLYARALTQVGEFDAARRSHEKAESLASDDAEIAAARVLDSLWLDESPARRAALSEDWARRFCPPAKAREWRRPQKKLVIGYLISSFSDPLDMAAVAAVARAHDRARVTVVAYVHGEQSWDMHVPLSGAFDAWRDIRTLDPATLARFFLRDEIHVAIDTAGFGAPGALSALARLNTALRVSWFGNPGSIGSPIYDARIVTASAGSGREERCRIPIVYPVLRPSKPVSRRTGDGDVKFGADVSMAQLDAETVGCWSAILDALPAANLLLRANDMEPGGNIERLIARFGRDRAARIDIIANESIEDFYAKLDVALLPRRGVSARAAADALACGVPPVAIAGNGISEPYAAFLRELGLGSRLVAADEAEFASIAAGLAAPAARGQLGSALASACAETVSRSARAIEDHALRMLDEGVGVSS